MHRGNWYRVPVAATAAVGAALVVTGEALILLAHRPVSDYYFPFVWLGLILLLDSAVAAHAGLSLLRERPRHFVALFPLSIAFWWLFELFNVFVKNWRYVGTGPYHGLSYVLFASLDFSLVLAAVWEASNAVYLLLPRQNGVHRARPPRHKRPPGWIMVGSACAGVLCIVLPILASTIFFGLIWVCLFFLLDPINAWLGRPSLFVAAWQQRWRLPLSFALGTLLCGFFWESWNEWAMPMWRYDIPYVGFWHVFQMPLLGWLGYLPFGLELFAMTNFLLPFLGLAPLVFGEEEGEDIERESEASGRRARVAG